MDNPYERLIVRINVGKTSGLKNWETLPRSVRLITVRLISILSLTVMTAAVL